MLASAWFLSQNPIGFFHLLLNYCIKKLCDQEKIIDSVFVHHDNQLLKPEF